MHKFLVAFVPTSFSAQNCRKMGTTGDSINCVTVPDSTRRTLIVGSRGYVQATISLRRVDIGEEASSSESPRGNMH